MNLTKCLKLSGLSTAEKLEIKALVSDRVDAIRDGGGKVSNKDRIGIAREEVESLLDELESTRGEVVKAAVADKSFEAFKKGYKPPKAEVVATKEQAKEAGGVEFEAGSPWGEAIKKAPRFPGALVYQGQAVGIEPSPDADNIIGPDEKPVKYSIKKVKGNVRARHNLPSEYRVYEVSIHPEALSKLKDKKAGVKINTVAQARAVNANSERVKDWDSFYKTALPLTKWSDVKKININGKLKNIPVVSLTKGCQRARVSVERVANGILPNETRVEACYGGDCWANRQFNRSWGNFENMEVKELKLANAEQINEWMQKGSVANSKIEKKDLPYWEKMGASISVNKKHSKKEGRTIYKAKASAIDWMKHSDFIRQGQQGDDSHLFASGVALEWLKAVKKYGIKKKTIFISAGYAPVTDAQYKELAPYKDLFEIHFSNSGWFHENEIMLRLGEFQAAKKAGLNASIRLVTNQDGVAGIDMVNDDFILKQMAKIGVQQDEILETPFHDDAIKKGKKRSEPTGDFKYVCCESGVCRTCPVKCMTKTDGKGSVSTSFQLKGKPRYSAMVPEMAPPEEAAQKYDLEYNGDQANKGFPTLHLFTDNKTGSTFSVKSLEDIPKKLESLHKQFGQAKRRTNEALQNITKEDVQDLFKWAKGVRVRKTDGAILVNTGPHMLRIKNVQNIAIDEAAFAVERLRRPKSDEFAAGSYLDGEIKIAKIGDKWTLAHESFHWMEDIGVVNRGDIRAIDRAIKQGDFKFEKGDSPAEKRAKWFEQTRQARDTKGRIGKIIEKIQDFIDSFVNLFHRTARGVVRDVESGKAFGNISRGTKSGQTSVPQYEKTAQRWYSQMQNFLERKLPGKAPAKQLKQMLTSWANKGEFKQDELDWSGVLDWVSQQDGKVSKQDVLNYLEQNNLRVEEVVKQDGIQEEMADAFNESGYTFDYDDYTGAFYFTNPDGDTVEVDELPKNLQGLIDKATSTNEPPKFSQYQLPGGHSYKELLITMPTGRKAGQEITTGEMSNQIYRKNFDDLTEEQKTNVLNKLRDLSEADKEYFSRKKASEYRSSHWDEPNVLAHVRFSERTVDGKRVLHIEEIQSDWHQAGRKSGYRDEGLPEGYYTRQTPSGSWVVSRPDGVAVGDTIAGTEENAIAHWNRINAQRNTSGVPDAPWKKTWPIQTFKRMVRYAAENGFDSIAWTPGEIQADRYDLSKQVDEIQYDEASVPSSSGEPVYVLDIFPKGEQQPIQKSGTAKQLEEFVGKEIVDKIQNGEGEKLDRGDGVANVLSGLDLKVGGKGMAGFYDKILPSEVKKFFGKKAWGKPRVGVIEINSGPYIVEYDDSYNMWTVVDSRNNDVVESLDQEIHANENAKNRNEDLSGAEKQELWHLPITPEMKSKALREGMPLYQTKGKKDTQYSLKSIGEKYALGNTQIDRARDVSTRYFNDAMYWIVDKNRPIQTVQNGLKKVTDDIDVFLKETQRPKIQAAKVKQAWEDDINPIITKMAEYKKSLPELEQYAHAMHAHEANDALRKSNAKLQYNKVVDILEGQNAKDAKAAVKDVKKPAEWSDALDALFKKHAKNEDVSILKDRWDKFSERPSGMSDAKADEILEQHKGDKQIEELRQMLSSINENRLQLLYDAGQIPDEEYNAIKAKYKNYVPLYREGFDDELFGAGRGLNPSGKQIKVRSGSTKEVVNIFANSVANYEKAINIAEKARSQRALYGLIQANKASDAIEIEPVPKAPAIDKDGNLKLYPKMSDVSKNEMRLMVDGKQYLVSVDRGNKDAMLMLRTLKGEDGMGGPIVNTLAKVNRFLARINTSWAPEFIVTNPIRDIQTAGVNIRDTGVEGKKMIRGAGKAAKAIFSVERGNRKGTEYEKYYDRFNMAGGKIGWADVHGSIENLAKKITKEIEMQAGKRPTRKTIKQFFDFIEGANTALENGVRLHAFKLAVDQGMTDERAAQMASDLTVDFTKKGAAGPVINSLYLFANAGIQGSYRIFRASLNKGPGGKRVRRIITGIFGAGFAVGLLNALAGGEDEDGEDYYNKIEDFIRERNMIIMLPGTKGKYVKIPLPWGYNFIWNAGTEASRAFTKEDYDPLASGGRLLSVAADAFNPVAAGTLLQTLSPTISDPFVMVAENKTWFGGDLMPAENKFAKVKKPDSQRYWKSASAPSKWVANQMNSLTGGDKVKKGMIDVSPETLDLAVDTVGGSAFRFFKGVVGVPRKLIAQEEVQFHEIPFWRRVAGQKSEWADSRTYFNNLTDVLETKERLKVYAGTPAYNKIKEANKELASLIPIANNYEKALRKLRRKKKKAAAAGNDRMVEATDKKIKSIYRQFNKKYYEHIQ